MENDPLDSPADCKCHGTGWVFVLEGYVRAHVRNLDDTSRVAATRNTVYPCKFHNARRFERWANGHYDRYHDSDLCAECRGSSGTLARRRKEAVPVETAAPTRRDIE